AGSLDNRFEITDESLKRDIVNIPVRETIAPGVISNEPASARQSAKHVPPDRTVPIVFQMIKPVRCLDQRRAFANRGICKPAAVGCRAESYLLGETYLRVTFEGRGAWDCSTRCGKSFSQRCEVLFTGIAELLFADLTLAFGFFATTSGDQGSDQHRV